MSALTCMAKIQQICLENLKPNSFQKAVKTVDRRTKTHVYVGCFDEGSDGMDVVVEDDDPDHNTQAEHHGLFAFEFCSVISKRATVSNTTLDLPHLVTRAESAQ